MTIRTTACCKINIGLNIVSKREDGYHNLETIFYPVPLSDEITITSAEEDGIDLAGHKLVGDPNENLVLRAVRLLRDYNFEIPHFHISLKKNIPSGAGLGGGSSDAATVMKELNNHLSLGLSNEEMEKMISKLGADCPFFIQCKPVFAEGIGDIFTPVDINLSGWHLVLVKPDDYISTKEAYSLIKAEPSKYSITEEVKRPVDCWKEHIKNDFEKGVFPNHPKVQRIRNFLYEMGASYACMSGSGSTVFGLFRQNVNLDKLVNDCFVYQCKL
jgi:4-diphosphocytidyl-2-C-methyl-D-erythritol kinase